MKYGYGTAYAKSNHIVVEVGGKNMNSEFTEQEREQEQEVMNILLNSALYGEMSEAEREQLLRYLVTSYIQPRVGENCRAHLRAVRSASGL
jgi:hypothetical protein